MSDVLTDVQEKPAALLRANEFFSNSTGTPPKPIAIITEEIGDVASKIAQSVAKIGIGVLVMTPEAPLYKCEALVPLAKPKLVFVVVENVTVNRGANGTQQPVAKVARAIAALLHLNQTLSGTDKIDLNFLGIFLNSQMKGHAARDVVFEVANPVSLSMPSRS